MKHGAVIASQINSQIADLQRTLEIEGRWRRKKSQTKTWRPPVCHQLRARPECTPSPQLPVEVVSIPSQSLRPALSRVGCLELARSDLDQAMLVNCSRCAMLVADLLSLSPQGAHRARPLAVVARPGESIHSSARWKGCYPCAWSSPR